MPRWPLVLLLASFACADGDGPRVDSIRFFVVRDSGSPPRCDPLVFWAPGVSERVLVRTRLSADGGETTARVVLSVEWGLLPEGAELRDEAVVWGGPEEVRSFEVALAEGGGGELLASIPIARRALEWRREGFHVVRCRLRADVSGGEARQAVLEVLPAAR